MTPEPLTDQERRLLGEVLEFGLLDGIFGRRSRRFGLGMEIPAGPTAYRSEAEPIPVEGLERDLLVAAACGAVGWHEAIPYRQGETTGLASYSLRLGGRAGPGGGGINSFELLYTADDGTFIVRSRDAQPVPSELTGVERLEQLVLNVRRQTERLSDERVEVPRRAPHMSEHNLWNANVPGSALFLPTADLGEILLGLLAMVIQNGAVIVDEAAGGEACGDLDPFIRSGLLDPGKRMVIGELEKYVLSNAAAEVSIVAHNITLAMQAVGLGGWFFTGINPLSLMGAHAEDGIPGLGFRFVEGTAEMVPPNPVGIDGVLESVCPPYVRDMHEAAARFAERKFGPAGTYAASTPGPYAAGVRSSAEPYSDELIACIGTVAQHVLDTRGRFPGTVPALYMRQFAQAHHIDLDWYDRYLGEQSYLPTHAEHHVRWHQTKTGERDA